MDNEDPNAMPQWDTGEETYLLGAKGIVVATSRAGGVSQPVEIRVYEGTEPVNDVLLVRIIIEIGGDGLFVGDPIYPYPPIPWPSGKTSVSVYVNAPPEYPEQNINRVTFVINR